MIKKVRDEELNNVHGGDDVDVNCFCQINDPRGEFRNFKQNTKGKN